MLFVKYYEIILQKNTNLTIIYLIISIDTEVKLVNVQINDMEM